MKNYKLKCAAHSILLLVIFTGLQVMAQTPVRLGPAPAAEIEKAFADVTANMDSLKAHRKYIYAKGMANPELWDQYEAWMKKYPDNANIPLFIGTVYFKAAMKQPKNFLLKAAEMNPKNAQIWYMLGSDADMGSQHDLFTKYMEKAASMEPANVVYAYSYVISFRDQDTDTYEKKVFDFVKRFPTDSRGANAIYQLGQRATNLNDKIHYYEELRKLYPTQKFSWSESAMTGLADAYLQTDPEKALVLINEMGQEEIWKTRGQMGESLIRINKLEQDQNYKDAIVHLDQVKLPGFNYNHDFIPLKRASLQAKIGDVKAAYDSLSVLCAKLPSDALYSALELYGKKLGKGKEQVDKDIETIRNSNAVPAYPFELGLYTSDQKLDLKSLRGKVVLLTFWFPGCAPCREEFPHFQTVVDSFKGDSLVYIGINVLPSQDGYVLPFMKNTKYSFIPLRGTNALAAEKYGESGQPANFVIDKEGNIVFKDFRTGSSNQRTLELMISSLLNKETRQ